MNAKLDLIAARNRFKAEKYDDVVKALHVADGGQYRNDTIESVVIAARRSSEQAALIAELTEALERLLDRAPDHLSCGHTCQMEVTGPDERAYHAVWKSAVAALAKAKGAA